MLRNVDFLVFSDDWGRHPFSCQHLMRRFLPGNRLIWVHTIGLRTPRLCLYDARRALEKLGSWLPTKHTGKTIEPRKTDLRPHILSPVMLPFNRIPGVRAFNRASVVRAVRRAMGALGLRAPVLLATLPNACDYVGAFGESLVVYYCVDDFSLWPGMNQPDLVREMERSLLAGADLVAATSTALCQSRGNAAGPARLLSHGVDVDHFAGGPYPCPPALADAPGPLIGFYGLLDQRLDLPLLREAARQRPDWTFALIGARQADLAALENLPNVRLIPPVDYTDLPAFAARFDAAMIPYRTGALSDSINPLKLREYLAAGKPVAGTPLPELLRLPGVHTGEGAVGFIRAVEAALADKTPPEARRAALAGQSWQDKAELLSGWIEEALARKHSQEAAA